MLTLKLQYFGHLMQVADSLEKTLSLGKIEGKRWSRQQRMGWLVGIIDSVDTNLSKLWRWWMTGKPGMWQSMGWLRSGEDWETEQFPQLSPRIASHRKGDVLSLTSLQSFLWWCEMEYLLSYQQTKMSHLSVVLASPNVNFWAMPVSSWGGTPCPLPHKEFKNATILQG